MKAPLICWRCAAIFAVAFGLLAWVYPPVRGTMALFVGTALLSLAILFGGRALVDTYIAHRIRRDGRLIRARGRTTIPAASSDFAAAKRGTPAFPVERTQAPSLGPERERSTAAPAVVNQGGPR